MAWPRTRVPSQLSLCSVRGGMDQGPSTLLAACLLQRRGNDWRPLEFASILNEATGCRKRNQRNADPERKVFICIPVVTRVAVSRHDKKKTFLRDKHMSVRMVLKGVWLGTHSKSCEGWNFMVEVCNVSLCISVTCTQTQFVPTKLSNTALSCTSHTNLVPHFV